jgi:protein-tyrosine phosphatase
MDTFVCLQAEFSMATPEAVWRSGQALRPYVKDAQRLLIQARATNKSRITQNRLDLLHLPIIDGGVTSDLALSKLADDCCRRILNGERMYVHCWGGHGRTGTLIAVMLSRLYGITTEEALLYTQVLHDVRKYPQNVRSPQTQVQVEQVRRILASERVGFKANEYQWPELPLKPYAANEIHFTGSKSIENAHRVAPPPPTNSNLPVFISPDTSMSSAKKALKASAAVLDPPLRSNSLIPAGVQGRDETENTDDQRNTSSPQPPGSNSSSINSKIKVQLVGPLTASSDAGR